MTTTLKPLYGSSGALTLTLNSLASDTNLLAGRSSTVVDNTSNLNDDELITGIIRTGTSPTGGQAMVYAWSVLDDTPTYPDTVTGSDANTTLTSANVQSAGAFKLGAVIPVDTTSNRSYPFSFSLAALFGGNMPKKWGIYVVHNTGVALNAASNVVSRIPMQYQNV